jgi:peptidoglycan/LPS O-acetylase OafA/YrhL
VAHEQGREPRALGYQPALDGLRAVAVLAVLVYHGRGDLDPRIEHGGFLGVDIFFVLSGYLITTLLIAEHERSGRIHLGAFWARRARRLLPALFLTIAVVISWVALVGPDRARETLRANVVATLLYVQNWHIAIRGLGAGAGLLSHTWSLSIEEQWYLVWPIAALLALRWARGRHLVLAGACGALAIASAVWMAVVFEIDGINRAYHGTDTRAQALLVGAALAFLLRHVDVRERVPDRIVEGLGIGAGVALFAATLLATIDGGYMFHGGYLLVALAAALVIVAAVHSDGPVRRALSWRPLVAVGLISYGVYLLHIPLFGWLTRDRVGFSGPPLFALRVVVTGAAATASFFLIERPVRAGRLSTGKVWIALPAAVVLLLGATAVVVAQPTTTKPRPVALSDDIVRGYERIAATAGPNDRRILVAGGTQAALLRQRYGGTFSGDGVIGTTIGTIGCGSARGWTVVPEGQLPEAPECARQVDAFRMAAHAFRPHVAVYVTDAQDLFDRRHGGETLVVGTPAWTAYMARSADATRAALTADGAKLLITSPPCVPEKETPPFGSVLNDHDRLAFLNSFWHDYARDHDIPVIGLGICDDGTPRRADGQPLVDSAGNVTAAGAAQAWQTLARSTSGNALGVADGDFAPAA